MIYLCAHVLVWTDNVDLLFEEDVFGIINMLSDDLPKLRELNRLVAPVELVYIYQTKISASR